MSDRDPDFSLGVAAAGIVGGTWWGKLTGTERDEVVAAVRSTGFTSDGSVSEAARLGDDVAQMAISVAMRNRRAAQERARLNGGAKEGGEPVVKAGRYRTAKGGKIQIVNYLDKRVPRGFITTIAGVGGLGKSTWTIDLAARTSRGDTEVGKPQTVIIFSAEDEWSTTIQPRLMAAGADLDRVGWIESAEGGDIGFSIPDDVTTLIAAIDKIESKGRSVGLVIIDPVTAFYADKIEANADASLRSGLQPLAAYLKTTNLALVAVTHLNKNVGADAWTRITGSAALFNLSRSVIAWGKRPDADDDDDRRVLVHAKHNLGPLHPPTEYRLEVVDVTGVGFDGNSVTVETTRAVEMGPTGFTAEEVLNGKLGADGDARRDAHELIRSQWRKNSGAVPVADLYAAAIAEGFDTETDGNGDKVLTHAAIRRLRRGLKDVGGETRKQGYGDGSQWHWVPPAGFFTQPATEEASG